MVDLLRRRTSTAADGRVLAAAAEDGPEARSRGEYEAEDVTATAGMAKSEKMEGSSEVADAFADFDLPRAAGFEGLAAAAGCRSSSPMSQNEGNRVSGCFTSSTLSEWSSPSSSMIRRVAGAITRD
jgi:hypothetical protein